MKINYFILLFLCLVVGAAWIFEGASTTVKEPINLSLTILEPKNANRFGPFANHIIAFGKVENKEIKFAIEKHQTSKTNLIPLPGSEVKIKATGIYKKYGNQKVLTLLETQTINGLKNKINIYVIPKGIFNPK